MSEAGREIFAVLPVISTFKGAGNVVARHTMNGLLKEPKADPRDYLSGSATATLERRLEAIANLFKSDVYMRAGRQAAAGSYGAFSKDLLKESEITSSAQNLAVRRYILAHELGHAALYAVLKAGRFSTSLQQQFNKEANRERFCREFSAEIVFPSEVLEKIGQEEITGGLSEAEQRSANHVMRDGGPRLNFYHLSSFARRAGIPLTIAVGAFHKHKVLAEMQAALSIFRVSTNVYTSQEWGLRTWMNSLPHWGFLPRNQRVARLGFLGAQDVLTKGQSGSSQQRMETLIVKNRRPAELIDGPRWRSGELRTRCSYTPIDVTALGRYLIVTWDWPRLD
jgi:hypothetical protein